MAYSIRLEAAVSNDQNVDDDQSLERGMVEVTWGFYLHCALLKMAKPGASKGGRDIL